MAAAKSNTNWFAIGVSIAVVVVLVALGLFVAFLNNQATAPGAAPEGGNVDKTTGAISFGAGEDEVDVFVDFLCPICVDFEDAYGEQLQTAAANDEITLNIHPVSILDRYSQGSEYSTRAAGAAYCVAENAPDSFLEFFNFMFANQPAENTAGYTDEQLAGFADQVGAGAASECIAEGTYMKFVADQTESQEIKGTPTVDINGERIDNADIATRFAEILAK